MFNYNREYKATNSLGQSLGPFPACSDYYIYLISLKVIYRVSGFIITAINKTFGFVVVGFSNFMAHDTETSRVKFIMIGTFSF